MADQKENAMRTFVTVLLVLGTTVAAADTIEEKRLKEEADKLVAFEMKSLNKNCKTTIPDAGIIDWSTWKELVNDKNSKVGSVCMYIAFGMNNLCRSDRIAQESVAKDIKKIVCKGDSTEDLKFELDKDGTLVVHTHLGMKDTDKKTKTWLTKNLQ
jgi:hypothetical protein